MRPVKRPSTQAGCKIAALALNWISTYTVVYVYNYFSWNLTNGGFRMRVRQCALACGLTLACASCFAQPGTAPQAFTCVANAGTPVIVRVEGITELVGDLLLQCTGGTRTPIGQPIPPTNLRLSLNTNITSRLLAGGNGGTYVDAVLLIDEPYPNGAQQVPPTVT